MKHLKRTAHCNVYHHHTGRRTPLIVFLLLLTSVKSSCASNDLDQSLLRSIEHCGPDENSSITADKVNKCVTSFIPTTVINASQGLEGKIKVVGNISAVKSAVTTTVITRNESRYVP